MKFIYITILCLTSTMVLAFGGRSSKKFTPSANSSHGTKRAFGQSRSFQKLDNELDKIQRKGLTRCNVSPSSAAQCLVCNCLNEINGYPEKAQVNVARTVFARAKSPKFPNKICSVVWQPSQFSWTIGVLDPRRKARYISKRIGSGANLNKCIKSTRKAADIELNKAPTKLFALFYFNPKLVRPSWARACNKVLNDGAHSFYDDCTGSGYRAPRRLTESAIASRN